MASADVLLHPVRLRIVQCLLGDRRLTTGELAAELPDVAPATLYRHVAALAKADVLTVVEEHRVRGAVQRRYQLRAAQAEVGRDDVAAMPPGQLRDSFGVFAASLLAAFDTYLHDPQADPAIDALGFRTTAIHLRREDLPALAEQLRSALEPWTAPHPGTSRHLFSTVLIPSPAPPR